MRKRDASHHHEEHPQEISRMHTLALQETREARNSGSDLVASWRKNETLSLMAFGSRQQTSGLDPTTHASFKNNARGATGRLTAAPMRPDLSPTFPPVYWRIRQIVLRYYTSSRGKLKLRHLNQDGDGIRPVASWACTKSLSAMQASPAGQGGPQTSLELTAAVRSSRSMARSRDRSATILFSRPFLSSNSRKRFISDGIKPAYFLRQLKYVAWLIPALRQTSAIGFLPHPD